MIKKLTYQKIFAIAGITVALALLIVGILRSHKIYETDTEDFGIPTFYRIGELQMVVDATFQGVVRKGEKFYSTYDRSKPRGKSACPT